MRATFAPLALAALAAANPVPSASFPIKTPAASAPAGCQTSVPGTFEIEIVNATTSSKTKRDGTPVVITLQSGILTDAQGRVGSIVANGQFQFDGPPPQSNAIYTAGWSVCSNGTLALGAETIFYECLSGMFYNLYDSSIGGQCSPIYIQTINGAGATAPATQMPDGQITASPVTQISDGQPQATTAPVTQISDGQIQGTTGKPVTQISDGQVQATTGSPVTQISDGQVQATTATGKPVTQISDGQVQASTGMPVTQISDGQVQATTGKPVTQISDGQVQGPTGKPVTQISDGQVQGPTGTPVTQISDGQVQGPTGSPVTQISDGQVQGPTGTPIKPTRTATPVTQISDGQVQGPTGVIPKPMPANGTVPAAVTGSYTPTVSPTIAAYTGAAAANAVGFFGLAAGAVAFAML